MARLAGSPLLVVMVTLAIGVAVTVVLMWAVPMDAVAIVSTLATLWGLDLALVIYLLTAKDTDKLLAHIDALQDQLSAALEGPGPGAVVVEGQVATPVQSQVEGQVTAPPVQSQAADTKEEAGLQTAQTPLQEPPVQPGPSEISPQPSPAPEVVALPRVHDATTVPRPAPEAPQPLYPQGAPYSEALPVTAYIPATYLEALRRQVGMEVADIHRAWTPNPHGNGPWVVEDAGGDRWSVFQGRHDRPTVISLETRERLRQRRDEERDEKLEHLRAVREARVGHNIHSTHDPHRRSDR